MLNNFILDFWSYNLINQYNVLFACPHHSADQNGGYSLHHHNTYI